MKKTVFTAIVLFALVSCATNVGFNDNRIICHRGAWKNTGFPQNSLASFKAAVELGAYGSEFDVQLTSDDSLVVFHDLLFKGVRIDSVTYAELQALGTLSNGEKIPTLREYLAEGLKQDKTKMIIDIKTIQDKDRTVTSAVLTDRVVKSMKAEDMVEYLAGHLPAVDTLHKITEIPVAYLGEWKKATEEMLPENVMARGITYVDFRYIFYKENAGWIEAFRNGGVNLNAWTVNDDGDIRFFLESGFDAVTTDEPEKAIEISRSL